MLRLMIACSLALQLSTAAVAEELDRPVVVDAVARLGPCIAGSGRC
jgi:hypothetical protein